MSICSFFAERCNIGEQQCDESYKCITDEEVCNGKANCPGYADERECPDGKWFLHPGYADERECPDGMWFLHPASS